MRTLTSFDRDIIRNYSMFKKTSHLSLILEESEKTPVIIFKYSNSCGTSDVLKEKLEKTEIPHPIYIVTVQEMPILSKKIEEMFGIKHESPQIIIINKGFVTYSASHNVIKTEDFSY